MKSLILNFQQQQTTTYNTEGKDTHSDIAHKLGISTSLAHRIEEDLMMKFALCLFNPPWNVQHPRLRSLHDRTGKKLSFGTVGQYFDTLEEVVVSSMLDDNEKLFRKAFELRIVEISRSAFFHQFVMSTLNYNDKEEV